MNLLIKLMTTTAIFLVGCSAAGAQTPSNSPYTIEQSVIGAGGSSATGSAPGNVYTAQTTVGQPVAGTNISNGSIQIQNGFFTPSPFAPTAALAQISGRVLTADGHGIQKAELTLTSGDGSLWTARSTSFGYFSFGDVPSGAVYILSVQTKQFQFTQNSQIIFVTENISDVNFTALPR